jgi:hypothetical protein
MVDDHLAASAPVLQRCFTCMCSARAARGVAAELVQIDSVARPCSECALQMLLGTSFECTRRLACGWPDDICRNVPQRKYGWHLLIAQQSRHRPMEMEMLPPQTGRGRFDQGSAWQSANLTFAWPAGGQIEWTLWRSQCIISCHDSPVALPIVSGIGRPWPYAEKALLLVRATS